MKRRNIHTVLGKVRSTLTASIVAKSKGLTFRKTDRAVILKGC